MPQVFISYSRDPDAHRLRVWELARRLSECGIDLSLDRDTRPAGPSEGWALWSEKQIIEAASVLVVCNQSYHRSYYFSDPAMTKGHGAAWEAHIIRAQLMRSPAHNEKVRVALFDRADRVHIPEALRDYHFYSLCDAGHYEALLSWLRPSHPEVATAVTWPLPGEYKWPLADRKGEFEFFRKVLTGEVAERLMFLRGKRGSGKTTVLAEFAAYARHQHLPAAIVDCKGCPKLEDVLETLRMDLQRDCPLPAFANHGTSRPHQFIADLQQLRSPVVLMFDTYHQASTTTQDWLEQMLFPRLEQAPAVVVVVAGQRVPGHTKPRWRSLVESRTLDPIDKVDDWADYLKRNFGAPAFSEEQLSLLTRAAAGKPATMVTLLSNLRKAAKSAG